MKRVFFFALLSVALATASYGTVLSPVSSVADLSTLSPSDGDTVVVGGYYNPGDGGGGQFQWSDTDTSTVDSGVVFNGSGSSGRWIRQGQDLTVRMFGAKGDGVAEDADAIQRALDTAEARQYPVLRFEGRQYHLSGVDPRSAAANSTTDGMGMTVPALAPGNGQIVFNTADPATPYTLLTLGKLQGTPHPLTLLGEGATLATDQEVFAPILLTVRPNFKGLVIQDLTIARTRITTTDYVPSSTAGTPNPVPLDPSGAPLEAVGTDTAWGLNRPGIQIGHFYPTDAPVPALNVDSVTLRNITFYDCHRALGVDGPPANDYLTHNGGLKILNVDHCSFLYPNGCAASALSSMAGGGQAFRMGTWVDTANLTNCYFDGCVSGDLTGASFPVPVDGFLFGSPLNLVMTGCTLRHFGIEGILNFSFVPFGNADPGSNPANITVPAVGGTITVYNAGPYGEANPPLTPTPGSLVHYGDSSVWTFVSANDDGSVTLQYPADPANPSNVYPGNPAPGSTVPGSGFFLTFFGIPTQTATITGNFFDGDAEVGRMGVTDPSMGYGTPAIRVDNCRTYIGQNTITNSGEAILTESAPSGEGLMNDSSIVDNYITMPPHTAEYVGIEANGDRMNITGNTVIFPNGGGVTGIKACSDDDQVTGNSVACNTPASENPISLGIQVLETGTYLDGNSTKNFEFGISATRGGEAFQTYTVDHHASSGDTYPVALTPGATWLHQTYSYSVPTSGWYQIAFSGPGHFSGTLSVSAADAAQSQSTAAISFAPYGLESNLQQLSVDELPAGILCSDLVLAGENQPELYARLTGSADAYSVTFDTTDAGAALLAQPVPASGIATVVNDSPSAAKTTITTSAPHGLSGTGNVIYLFSSVSGGTGFLGTFPVVSIPNSTTLVVSGVPSEAPNEYLVEPAYNAPPAGSIKVLSFDLNGPKSAPSLQVQTGAILTGTDGPGLRTPDYLGEYFIDTTNHQIYVADGTTAGTWVHLIEDEISGAGNPIGAVTPDNVNEYYFDTTDNQLFVSNGPGNLNWGQIPQTAPDTSSTDLQLDPGTSALPSFFFGNDHSTGLFSNGAGTIGISAGGSLIAQINSQGLKLNGGSASLPSFFFGGDSSTGLFSNGTGTIGISAGGSLVAQFNSQGLRLNDGLAAAPSLFFSGDTETGIFSTGAGYLNFSISGDDLLGLDSLGVHENGDVTISGVETILPAPLGTPTYSAPSTFVVMLSAKTTSTSGQVELTLDGNAPGSSNVLIPPANTSWGYYLTAVGYGVSGSGGSQTPVTKIVRRWGVLKNFTNPSTGVSTLSWAGSTDQNDTAVFDSAATNWGAVQVSSPTRFQYKVGQSTSSFPVNWTARLEVEAVQHP